MRCSPSWATRSRPVGCAATATTTWGSCSSPARTSSSSTSRASSERPLGERRLKRSPLTDLAGSAAVVPPGHAWWRSTTGRSAPTTSPQLRPWVRSWRQWASAVVLKAYLERAGDAPWLPTDIEELARLLEFLLDRAGHRGAAPGPRTTAGAGRHGPAHPAATPRREGAVLELTHTAVVRPDLAPDLEALATAYGVHLRLRRRPGPPPDRPHRLPDRHPALAGRRRRDGRRRPACPARLGAGALGRDAAAGRRRLGRQRRRRHRCASTRPPSTTNCSCR